MDLESKGWTRSTLKLIGGAAALCWEKGPFFIYEETLYEDQFTFLKCVGFPIDRFAGTVDAVIAAEILLPLEDWEKVLSRAKSNDDAVKTLWNRASVKKVDWPFFDTTMQSGLSVQLHTDRAKGKEPQLAA